MRSSNYMSGKEFVRRILHGQRDFHGVKIEEGFDLSSYISRINKYISKTIASSPDEYLKNPFDLRYSRMRSLIAKGLYLPAVNARGADFRGADFRGADFREADFREADLEDVNAEEAYFGGTNFEKADLRWGDFRWADFRWGVLRRVKATGADFREAVLWGADLRWGDFREADFREADLEDVNAEEADFRRAVLRWSDFRGGVLRKAKLGGADFWGVNLRAANFLNAEVCGACFCEADLRGAENLEQALFVEDAWFGNTTITEEQKPILEKVARGKHSFIVRKLGGIF